MTNEARKAAEERPGQRKILLAVEYEGTRYHGWQHQEGLPTVQGRLQAAIADALGETAEVEGASRTDRGVHASGQAAAFLTRTPVPAERIPLVLNGRLPEDIRVRSAQRVPEGFSPRFGASGKIYRYTFVCRSAASVFVRRFASAVDRPLLVDLMREAAAALVGTHDFRSFANKIKGPLRSAVRELFGVEVFEDGPLVHIQVGGSSFLYKMVRNIAGTLLEVGLGRRAPESVARALRACDRRAAGPTAPPRGLCLMEVCYSPEALLERLRCRARTDLWEPAARESAAGASDGAASSERPGTV